MENQNEKYLANLPSPGYYRHFKGNYYQLLNIANNSETLEPMVIYLALYGERELWVRPASMWNEIIEREDYRGPRFIPVDVADVPEEALIEEDFIPDEIDLNVDDYNCDSSMLWDIDPGLAEFTSSHLTEEQRDFLRENLFKEGMPITLGFHLLQCASSENKSKNANKKKLKPNGRCISIMLRALDEMGFLIFQTRSDLTRILTLVYGTYIEEDKHLLDYFYTRKDERRVMVKLSEYKQAIQLWLGVM